MSNLGPHPHHLLPQHHLLTKAELSHLYHRGSVALAQALSLSRLRSLYYLQCRTQSRRQSSPSRTQSPSRAFLVVVGSRSSRSRDWSSLSLPVSSLSHTQSRAFVAFVALVAAGGRSNRFQG
ncbi:hypothetical protein AHAS_Ahas15G0289900 [Arachis hypogaea]